MKVVENFEQKTSIEESIDEKTFVEFMKKVVIWDYFAIYKANLFSNVRTKKER